jgi:diadenosine tetraphosphate (Ap4A) HIT family hydrolase
MASVFTRIVAGETAAHMIREDDRFLALPDIRPIRSGHTLVVPKTRPADQADRAGMAQRLRARIAE